jgi:transposase
VTSDCVILSEDQRLELSRIAQSRSLPAGYVFRAKLILMLSESASYSSIKLRLGTTAPTISRWKRRFLAAGLDGLDTAHPGQKPSVLTAKLRARILAATRKPPKDGSTHWSCRKLAAGLGISKDAVHRAWQEAGLKPHRLERYMASDDPDFETKAADIIGLYLNPPEHAAAFCVDEKPPFRPWTGSIPSCRSRQDGSSATVSNTAATEHCRSMPRWKRPPVVCTAKPQLATPARSSSPSSKKSSHSARPIGRFTSSSTTCPPIRPSW